MKRDVLARPPLRHHGPIPVFSDADDYTENYEKISADHLNAMAHGGGNPWIEEGLWNDLERSTIALLQKYSKPGDAVLDVGVGLGRLLSHFPDRDRYGMDISFGYLEKAAANGIDVCYARIEDMPYVEGAFDAVVCTDVLEHVLDLHLSCRRILESLRPGGVLIVRVPNREDLSQYVRPDFPYQFVHLRNFDEHSLRLLFEKALCCEFLEATPGAWLPDTGRLKYRLPIPKFNGLLARALIPFRWLHRGWYRWLVSLWYHPFEINVAVRKK